MKEHEKRIREALEAGPTEGPFIAFGDQVYRATDPDLSHPLASWNTCPFTMEGVSIDALYYAACNPTALRALLADLDAMRGLLRESRDTIDTLPGYPKGADLCDRIDAALKGAEA